MALHFIGAVVPIDQNWLNSNSQPYLLNQPDTTYILQTDVNTDGTSFIVCNKNIVLDLNGHTITYGNAPQAILQNGGFEDGTAGWDLSQTQNAIIKPIRPGMWGSNMLHIENFTKDQILTSSPVVLKGNHEYAATITPKFTSYQSSCKLDVVEVGTDVVLGTKTQVGGRGIGVVATFSPTTDTSVYLRATLIYVAGVVNTVDLDYADVSTSRDYGVLASPSSYNFPIQYSSTAIKNAATKCTNFTLKNGKVVSGNGRPSSGDNLFFKSIIDLTVTDVECNTNGFDSQNIDCSYAKNLLIKGCRLTSIVDNITDRLGDSAAIFLEQPNGNVIITGNTIVDAPQCGITVFSNKLGSTIVITDNKISTNSITTNGYSILFASVTSATVQNNECVADSGKGLMIDNFGTRLTDGILIKGNKFVAYEKPDLEYGNNKQTSALRMRAEGTTIHRNIVIDSNEFTAITDEAANIGAIGARLSYTNTQGETGILFKNNTFRGLVKTANKSFFAYGFSVSGITDGAGIKFDGNTFSSNDTSITIGDSNSYGQNNANIEFNGTINRDILDGIVRLHTPILIGSQKNGCTNVRFVGMQPLGGAGLIPLFTGATFPKDISIGWYATVLAGLMDNVSILDPAKNIIYQGVGPVSGVKLMEKKITQSTANPTVLTETHYGPYEFKAVVQKNYDSINDVTSNITVDTTKE